MVCVIKNFLEQNVAPYLPSRRTGLMVASVVGCACLASQILPLSGSDTCLAESRVQLFDGVNIPHPLWIISQMMGVWFGWEMVYPPVLATVAIEEIAEGPLPTVEGMVMLPESVQGFIDAHREQLSLLAKCPYFIISRIDEELRHEAKDPFEEEDLATSLQIERDKKWCGIDRDDNDYFQISKVQRGVSKWVIRFKGLTDYVFKFSDCGATACWPIEHNAAQSLFAREVADKYPLVYIPESYLMQIPTGVLFIERRVPLNKYQWAKANAPDQVQQVVKQMNTFLKESAIKDIDPIKTRNCAYFLDETGTLRGAIFDFDHYRSENY